MKHTLALALVLCLLAGCGQTAAPSTTETTAQTTAQAAAQTTKESRTVFAMDTVMSLTVYAQDTAAALDAGEQELYRLDALLSISSEGDIAVLNQNGTAQISQETAQLLGRALDLAQETGGCYDPTVYPLVDLWGFYGETEDQRVPEDAAIQAALAQVGYQDLRLEDTTATLDGDLVGVDLGGIAKGYASEQVIEALAQENVSGAVISLGGNVATLGEKSDGSAWSVAVEDPENTSSTVGTLHLAGGYFAVTSGAYERYFIQDGVRYHHILDPATGYPAQTDLKSVTVVSQDGTLADGLSTALFVMGFDRAVDFWRDHSDQFGLVLITDAGIFVTPDLDFQSSVSVTTLEGTP